MLEKYNNARAKLIQTIKVLATNDGDIWARLWLSFIYFKDIKPEELPECLREEFSSILNSLVGKEPLWSNGYPVRPKKGYIQNRTAQKIASKLFNVTEKLRTIYETEDRSRPFF